MLPVRMTAKFLQQLKPKQLANHYNRSHQLL